MWVKLQCSIWNGNYVMTQSGQFSDELRDFKYDKPLRSLRIFTLITVLRISPAIESIMFVFVASICQNSIWLSSA